VLRGSAKSCIFAVTVQAMSLCLRKTTFNQDTIFFRNKAVNVKI
jgi:hypothetical protein